MTTRNCVPFVLALSLAGAAAVVHADEVPPDDTPPEVSITAPEDGASFPAGTASLTVYVAAADEDSGVGWVRLYVDGTEVGKAASPPWRFESIAITPGEHELVAEAQNYEGSAANATAKIRVEAPPTTAEADAPRADGGESKPKSGGDKADARDGCFASARPRSLAGSGIALLFAVFAGLMLRRRT